MTAIPSNAQIIPCTTAPYQSITVQLGGQATTINLYTKSINVPKANPVLPIPAPPVPTPAVPPQYENINPVFIDLYVANVLIIGGVLVYNNVPIVRDAYLGFIGDIVMVDTQGTDDPTGIPYRLPPQFLKNIDQLGIGPANAEFAPSSQANTIPGLGSRFLLCYLPPA